LGARYISCALLGARIFWLRYKDYRGLRRTLSGARFSSGRISFGRGSVVKAWVEMRGPLGASPVGRGGEVRRRLLAGRGWSGRVSANVGPPRSIALGTSGVLATGEEGRGRAGVGGQPVQVFVVERFGGVAGGVDDADGVGPVGDRDGQ
jgi:hypothetical protein